MSESTLNEAPVEAPASRWEDYIDIFYAPRQVFARRQGSGFGLTLLLLTVVVTALFFASQGPLGDAYAAEFRRGMENAGAAGQQMTPEQMEQAQRFGSIIGTLSVLIGFPVTVLLVGLILWMLGKLFGFVGTVSAAVLIVTYAQFPRVLQSLAALLQGLFLNPDSLAATTLGPARFMDPDTTSPVLLGFMSRVDLFYLWSAILMAIGAQVIGKVPRVQSYILAALVWLVGALPVVAGGLAR